MNTPAAGPVRNPQEWRDLTESSQGDCAGFTTCPGAGVPMSGLRAPGLSLIIQLNGELSLKKGEGSLRFPWAKPRANQFPFRLPCFTPQ
jgi:hypothetical protein